MASPHGSGSHRAAVTRASSSYVRTRATKACQVCRARRTKCDQKRPACSFCVKTGTKCTFEPEPTATFDQASLAIIDRLDRLEKKIDAQSAKAALASDDTSRTPATPHHHPEATRADAKLDRAALIPLNLDALMEWSVFKQCPSASARSATTSPYEYNQARSLDQPTAFLGDNLDPSRCDQWVQQFFAYVNVKNPILQEEYTRRLVRQLCLQGPSWDLETCLALLVCANGALARPLHETLGASDPDIHIAKALFNTAQRRLGPGIVSVGLIQAQCAFLSGVLLMALLRPLEAWTMFSHGLTISQTLPSIRKSQASGGYPAQSEQDASEQSIFWSCWKSEKELRSELGLIDSPSRVDEPPHLFPTPPPVGCEGHVEKGWYFYLSEISLWRLEVDARRSIEQLTDKCLIEALPALGQIAHQTLGQVDDWRDSLPSIISINKNEPSLEEDVIRFVLRGRVTYVHELVSWPFLHALLHGDNLQPGLEQWVDRILYTHYDRLLVNTPGFYHRHHGTWLMIRSTARSAFLLLTLCRVYDSLAKMPDGWRSHVLKSIRMLEYWSFELEDLIPTVEILNQLFRSTE